MRKITKGSLVLVGAAVFGAAASLASAIGDAPGQRLLLTDGDESGKRPLIQVADGDESGKRPLLQLA